MSAESRVIYYSYNNDGNAVYRVRKRNKGMEKWRKGSVGIRKDGAV